MLFITSIVSLHVNNWTDKRTKRQWDLYAVRILGTVTLFWEIELEVQVSNGMYNS